MVSSMRRESGLSDDHAGQCQEWQRRGWKPETHVFLDENER